MPVGKTVLLVEDDRFVRRACEAGLRQRGFTVVAAADGAEGLAAARTCHPDIVLLDLLLPKMSGVDLLRAMKADEATRGIPVVILSNSAREGDKQASLELGAAGYFVKANMSLRELGDHVVRLTGSAASGRSLKT
jgi:chemosensory pili system protein ChpA (sensor histidine kinase/response regulator)